MVFQASCCASVLLSCHTPWLSSLMLLCSRARFHPPRSWQMSPQSLRKVTTLALKTTVQYHCSAWSPKLLNAASTRKFCPFYSQLFPMDNTALCQIGPVLHNLLILLIILVPSMTGGVTPMLCTGTSQRHLTRSTIPSLLRSSRVQVSASHSLPVSTIIWRADCREWSSVVRILTCHIRRNTRLYPRALTFCYLHQWHAILCLTRYTHCSLCRRCQIIQNNFFHWWSSGSAESRCRMTSML